MGKNCGKYMFFSKIYFNRKMVHVLYDFCYVITCLLGFPDTSVGKESACNAGDTG